MLRAGGSSSARRVDNMRDLPSNAKQRRRPQSNLRVCSLHYAHIFCGLAILLVEAAGETAGDSQHPQASSSLQASNNMSADHTTFARRWRGSIVSAVLLTFFAIAALNLANYAPIWTGRGRRSTMIGNTRRSQQVRHGGHGDINSLGRRRIRYLRSNQRKVVKSMDERFTSHSVLRQANQEHSSLDRCRANKFELTDILIEPTTVRLSQIAPEVHPWQRRCAELAAELTTDMWGREQGFQSEPSSATKLWGGQKIMFRNNEPKQSPKRPKRKRHLGTVNRKHAHRDIGEIDQYTREHKHIARKIFHREHEHSFHGRATKTNHKKSFTTTPQIASEVISEVFPQRKSRVTFAEIEVPSLDLIIPSHRPIDEDPEVSDDGGSWSFENRPSILEWSLNSENENIGTRFHEAVLLAKQHPFLTVHEVTYV
eukprot:m.456255 g.456255  ORF g.456255 m.456255 type:complete len:426 (+) comp21023_c0_seq1:426-1703(+)